MIVIFITPLPIFTQLMHQAERHCRRASVRHGIEKLYKAGFAPCGCPGVGVPGAINYSFVSPHLHLPSPFLGVFLTSFCALCAISSALSCSTIICSSLYASAHGTPNNNALVLTTHSVLPPMNSPDLSHDDVVFTFELMLRRVLAGIMSCSARMRSYRVSSVGAEAMEEVSDSAIAQLARQFTTQIRVVQGVIPESVSQSSSS